MSTLLFIQQKFPALVCILFYWRETKKQISKWNVQYDAGEVPYRWIKQGKGINSLRGSARVAILNLLMMDDLFGKVAFKQRLKEGKKGAVILSQGSLSQAEGFRVLLNRGRGVPDLFGEQQGGWNGWRRGSERSVRARRGVLSIPWRPYQGVCLLFQVKWGAILLAEESHDLSWIVE